MTDRLTSRCRPAPAHAPSARTRFPAGRGEQGFTLIEVLAAFMILAVGLLALEALAIGSARMVARAERLADYHNHAVSHLERALSDIRLHGSAASSNAAIRLAEVRVRPTSSHDGRYWFVRVSVRPAGDAVLAAGDSFNITGHVLVE